MKMTLRTLAAIAAIAASAATLARADSSRDVTITEARANADNTILQVTGANFSGGTPKLTLGKTATPLTITLATPTQIEALLPAGFAPGSYLLTLTVSKHKKDKGDDSEDNRGDEFWVTLGAAGPQGPIGAIGPQGLAGATGAQGPAGPQGQTGPAGSQGPIGATGPAGSQGPMGAMGPAGQQGLAGAKGDSGSQGPAGATGPQGPQGATGPQGPAGGASSRVLITKDFTVPAASSWRDNLICPADFHNIVTGGAFVHDAPPGTIGIFEPPGSLIDSAPLTTVGWTVTARNDTGRPFNAITVTFTMRAICTN